MLSRTAPRGAAGLVAAIAVHLALGVGGQPVETCGAPTGGVATHAPWPCSGHVATDWQGGGGLAGFNTSISGWTGGPVGVFSADRVTLGSDGLHLEVKDTPSASWFGAPARDACEPTLPFKLFEPP